MRNDTQESDTDWCANCGETVDGMGRVKFVDGTEGWLCPSCEEKIRNEQGVVMLE